MVDKDLIATCVRRAEPTVVYTPLPSSAKGPAPKEPEREADPCVRAEAEDDDGYDPYSDRREETPFFESDPWS